MPWIHTKRNMRALVVTVLLLYSWFICDVLLLQGIPQQKNDSDCGVFVLEVWLPILTAVLLPTHSSLLLSHLQLWGMKKKNPGLQCLPSSSFWHKLNLCSCLQWLLPMSIINMSIQSCLWIFLSLTSIPSVLCCQYCRCLSVKQPLQFSQEDMPHIRKRIYKELCECRLNDWTTERCLPHSPGLPTSVRRPVS